MLTPILVTRAQNSNWTKPVRSKSCREGEKKQEVGDDLSVSVLNILLKVSSLCDLM